MNVLCKNLLTSALLLGSLWASAEQQQQQLKGEKAAEGAEGWITYAPAATESFIIDNYRLASEGFVLGGAAGE